jgi:hypothetical protein
VAVAAKETRFPNVDGRGPDATLVKSHGRRPADKKDWPVFISERPETSGVKWIESTDVFRILLRHIMD